MWVTFGWVMGLTLGDLLQRVLAPGTEPSPKEDRMQDAMEQLYFPDPSSDLEILAVFPIATSR